MKMKNMVTIASIFGFQPRKVIFLNFCALYFSNNWQKEDERKANLYLNLISDLTD